jgi:NitT/TauT family transport system substrate-binding protein
MKVLSIEAKGSSARDSVKRIMFTLTAVALVLAGCGGTEEPVTEAPAATQEPADPGTEATESPDVPAESSVPMGEPEMSTVRIGISVADSAYLPVYVCARMTCAEEGLDVQLFTFQGDAETNQALLGGSVDLNVQSLSGPMNAINAGQPVRVFYAGMNQADFAWVAQPDVETWEDLRGRSIGVTTYGSLTDTLTRYALQANGLEPEVDIRIVQAGGSPTSWPTIRAGTLDAGILSMNFWLTAQDEGFTILGHQSEEIAPSWPKEVFAAPEDFIRSNPNTITALLRGFARAVLMIKEDKQLGVDVLVDELDYEPERASQVYDFILPQFHADGRMAEEALPVFWELQETLGNVDGPWEPQDYMITDWLDTYAEWGPE